MKAAIEKGFNEAREAHGEKLPDGLAMTYNDLMLGLDWMKENSPKTA